MNVTAHPSIPGLYNAWDEEVFSTIRAMNMPEGRIWRTHAYAKNDYPYEGPYLGDFPTKTAAIQAVKEWSETL